MTEEINTPQRRLRSFVRRQGRLTEGQNRALEQYWAGYGLTLDAGLLNFQEIFGNDGDVILEIGFGDGASLLEMASQSPEKNFIGIEVHRPGVGKLINDAHRAGIDNLRVFCEDAIEVLAKCIADHSLAGVQLYFPDPWHKKRHNKRRIVQVPFVMSLHRKLRQGGYFHMATDWEPYAEHMMDVMTSCEGYTNKEGLGQFAPRPSYRPVTKFEKRGERLGHGVWDLIFTKQG